MHLPPENPYRPATRLGLLTAALLIVLIAWDLSGLDLTLARWVGGPQGFPHRNDWLLTEVLHDGVKHAAWGFTLLLCLTPAWPVGALTRLPFSRRLQLPVVALLSSALIAALKANSGTSCPWDLNEFGGVAHHLSHWSGWLAPDGGAGRCFPAGHASTGFAFVGGYFALRERLPGLARAWLIVFLVAGFGLGAVQQWRGAHFMSHTLWTAWLCWTAAWLTDPLFQPRQTRAVAVRAFDDTGPRLP